MFKIHATVVAETGSCLLHSGRPQQMLDRGLRYLTGENLKVVLAVFSTLS